MKLPVILIGSSVALAAGVLLVALSGGRDRTAAPTLDSLRPIAPLEAESGRVPAGKAIVRGSYHIRRRTASGRIQELSAQTYDPLPDGAADVTNLRATLYASQDRALQIRAGRGRIVAPDDVLQSGTLRDNVVLLLLRRKTDRPVDPVDPESYVVTLRCDFDGEVHFETELGKIRSNEHVHLTTPQIDLTSHGLHLSYDEAAGRIGHLTGLRGGSMRFKHQAHIEPKATPGSPGGNPAATGAEPAPGHVPAPALTPAPAYYLARIQDQIVIETADGQVHGDVLEAVFHWDRPGHTDRRLARRNGPGAAAIGPVRADPWPVRRAGAATWQSTALIEAASAWIGIPGPGRSMTRPNPKDIRVRWQGQLTIDPADPKRPPAARLAGPDDLLLKVQGRPLRMSGRDDQTVSTASLEYLQSSSRIRLTGSTEHPMVLDSPVVGIEIRGPNLVLNQQQSTGRIVGAGSLKAHDRSGLIEAIEPNSDFATGQRRLPPSTEITWQDGLDLDFYSRSDGDRMHTGPLRSTVFRGDVDLHTATLNLKAQRLALQLYDDQGQQQGVSQILATGQVQVVARRRADPFDLKAGWLRLQLPRPGDHAAGSVRMVARQTDEPVVAQYDQTTLQSGSLDVTLRPNREPRSPTVADGVVLVEPQPTATAGHRAQEQVHDRPGSDRLPAPTDEPDLTAMPAYAVPDEAAGSDGHQPLAIELVIAQQNVRIEIPGDQTVITAQRVVGHVDTGRLQLFGTPLSWARLEHDRLTLSGPYLVMQRNSQTVRAIGPGQMLFHEPEPEGLELAAELKMRWANSMQLDRLNRLAQLVGQVVVHGQVGRDTFDLEAGNLRIAFAELLPGRPDAADADGRHLVGQAHAIRTLEARDQVRFLAENWLDHPGEHLASSVLIEGPRLDLVNTKEAEAITVTGPGSMVYLDQRPASGSDGPVNSAVALAGRGKTLFSWAEALTLDARHNDMLMRRNVQMVHLADGQTEPLQLDCQRLLADLKATGGLKMWLGSTLPSPAVQVVKADGAVRVISDPYTITTDQLTYTGANQQVRLDARDGWTTQVWAPQVGSLSGRRLVWHLETGRFEVIDPGPIRVNP